jgi:hypothetical protein
LRSTALKKAAVVFQVTAIVLLQFYAVAPLIFKTFTAHASSIQCVGDHKKCGCSPFKVSSQTCCCFKTGKIVKTAFSTDVHDSETNQQVGTIAEATSVTDEKQKSCCIGIDSETTTASQTKTDKTIPEIKSNSCCGDPDHIFTSLEQSKFIRQQLVNIPPQLSSFVTNHQTNTFHDRFLEPPVPPPQNTIVA